MKIAVQNYFKEIQIALTFTTCLQNSVSKFFSQFYTLQQKLNPFAWFMIKSKNWVTAESKSVLRYLQWCEGEGMGTKNFISCQMGPFSTAN